MASRSAIASPRPEPDQRVLYTQSAVIKKFTIRTADFKGSLVLAEHNWNR